MRLSPYVVDKFRNIIGKIEYSVLLFYQLFLEDTTFFKSLHR